MAQEGSDALNVPGKAIYLHSSHAEREKNRKVFNDMALKLYFKFLKTLKDKALQKIGQEAKAFPYKIGLKSLSNASALYALIKYAETYNRPIGIEWYILAMSQNQLDNNKKYTASYKIKHGQWIPEKNPTKGLMPVMSVFVTLKKNKPFRGSLFAKTFRFTRLEDIKEKHNLSHGLYQLAAFADLVDFTSISPGIAKQVEAYVTKHLPLKTSYQDAHRLYQLMGKNDHYKNDDDTYRTNTDIMRLNHAFLAKMPS